MMPVAARTPDAVLVPAADPTPVWKLIPSPTADAVDVPAADPTDTVIVLLIAAAVDVPAADPTEDATEVA
jgi:hypothetical protein